MEARDPDSIKEVHRIVLFYETLYSKGPRALIKKMVSVKYRYEDLQLLPVGVSLPLLEAIYACKFDPPGEWPFEAYCLIGREDLAELLTKKKTSSRLHKAAEREVSVF